MQNSSPEEQAALLVTWYKQGPAMLARYRARLEQEGQKTDMRPGEGAAMFHNITDIWEVLR